MTTQDWHAELQEILTRGRNLRGCGYPARSLPFFLRATQLAPDNQEARQELQITRDQIHALFAVVSQQEHALADHPVQGEALRALADALTRLDRDDEALTALQQALVVDPDDREALMKLGHLLNDNGQYEEAIVLYERLSTLEPEWSHPWACKGMALCNLRRYADALPELDHAIALDAGDILGWTMKVHALCMLGRDEEARAAREWEVAARRASGVPRWMPPDTPAEEDGQ